MIVHEEEISLPLIDYEIVIDNYAYNHINRRHKKAIKDLDKLAEVISKGKVVYTGMRKGCHSLKFSYNGYTAIVTVHVPPLQLRVKTYYKK